jgi:membrane-associated phospholipid phosphatase
VRALRAPTWMRWVNAAWCLGIAWSTVAVRQHVVLDVVGGLLLGALFALASRPGRARV